MDSQKSFQVGVILEYPPFSPLSLRERARVRATIQLTKHPKADTTICSKQKTNQPLRKTPPLIIPHPGEPQ
jgi:hypothetical protein